MSRPAIFLDRDGVLTVEKSYVTSLKELEIFPYTRECIQKMHSLGYYAICITNQSAVGRGMMSESDLKEINDTLINETGLDAIYYCPHFWKEKKKICNCRKPEIGLIEKAQKDFEIDMQHSFMVGDRASDILCGEKAGVTTILLESGYGSNKLEQEVEPDYICKDLLDAIDFFL